MAPAAHDVLHSPPNRLARRLRPLAPFFPASGRALGSATDGASFGPLMPRAAAVVAAILAAWAVSAPRASAESCADGDTVGRSFPEPSAASWAGSSLAAHASFAGLPATSAALGPISLTEVEADEAERLVREPGVRPAVSDLDSDRFRVAAASRRTQLGRTPAPVAPRPLSPPAPMCAEGSDDPRCQPRAPNPAGGFDLGSQPLRVLGPPWPDLPGPDSALADDPVPSHGPRAGTRSRVERPPRGH